jgi:hypothetical protein
LVMQVVFRKNGLLLHFSFLILINNACE